MVNDSAEDVIGDEADFRITALSSVVLAASVAALRSDSASAFALDSISVFILVLSTVVDDADDDEGHDGDRASIEIDGLPARILGEDGLFLITFVCDGADYGVIGPFPIDDKIKCGEILRISGLD